MNSANVFWKCMRGKHEHQGQAPVNSYKTDPQADSEQEERKRSAWKGLALKLNKCPLNSDYIAQMSFLELIFILSFNSEWSTSLTVSSILSSCLVKIGTLRHNKENVTTWNVFI